MAQCYADPARGLGNSVRLARSLLVAAFLLASPGTQHGLIGVSAEDSSVDLSLSCEGLCNTGLRATNGLEETVRHAEAAGIYLQSQGGGGGSALRATTPTADVLRGELPNCCTDYAATCASTGNQGSCTLVAPDGSTSELCGSYNDADLCGCDPPCVDFGTGGTPRDFAPLGCLAP
eukprot:scaffold1885_cov402-Prasinococcus_capsulatus_cf.AAC.2